MEKLELFNPKFSGQRFNDVTLPFEVLGDISIYQDLLLQVAKDIYYSKNNRAKVPKNFGNGVYLKLSGGFKEGSTITNVILAAVTFFVGDLDTKDYFLQAQEKITHTISLAEQNGSLSGELSENALKLFKGFGKHLKDDEAIFFSPEKNPNAKFTSLNRRKILISSSLIEDIESDIDERGTISGVDKFPRQFSIITKDKIKIAVPVDDKEYFKIVENAYLNFESEQRVLISATGVYNKQNKLYAIKNIKSIILLDKNDVPTQLEKFSNYKDGWMNGEGKSFSPQDLKWLSSQFDEYYSRELLLPITFPMLDGGVEFHWKLKNHDITLDVNLKERTGYLNYLDTNTSRDEDFDLNLDEAKDWKILNNFLTQYAKG